MKHAPAIVFGTLILSVPLTAKQKLDVTIVERRDSTTDYTYAVSAVSDSTTNTEVRCNDVFDTVTCKSSSATSGVSSPARQFSFQVRGATFTLKLPDSRLVVVNCESKKANRAANAFAALGEQGPTAPTRRSCRVPLIDNIQAEFDGDNAKLIWPVSLDGKKMESETYKILAVLNKQ